MVYDTKSNIVIAILLLACFCAGYLVRGIYGNKEYNNIRASHERIKSELESARNELFEAERIISELESRTIDGKLLIDGTTENIRRATDISGALEDMDESTWGALERIRSILSVGDGGRGANGGGVDAGAGGQHPP